MEGWVQPGLVTRMAAHGLSAWQSWQTCVAHGSGLPELARQDLGSEASGFLRFEPEIWHGPTPAVFYL